MRMCGEGVGKFSSTGGSAQARPDLLGAASRRLGAPEPHPSTGMTEGLATQSEVARFAGVDPQLVRQSPQIPSRGDYGGAPPKNSQGTSWVVTDDTVVHPRSGRCG
jgi:hypothetical protein